MMPEILTESFCERCGTRYTFESAAPKKARRIGQIKTLSRGMKNWVMSDDTSLDEAMAAARNDEDREVTSQQLDAFHATFNFCMTCRQYTCSNCWNAAEGRCLTCAPHLGHEVLPAPFPDEAAFEPVRLDAEAWPEVDLSAPGAAAASGNGNGLHPAALDSWASAGVAGIDDIPEIDPAARLAFLSGETPLPSVEPEPAAPAAGLTAWPAADELAPFAPLAPAAEPAPSGPVAAEAAWPAAEPLAPAAAEALAAEEAPAAEPIAPEVAAAAVEPVQVEPEVPARPVGATPAVEPLPPTVDGRADVGAARTADLLRRFRPGQNIDAELAAYEAELDRAEPVGEPATPAEPVAAAAAEEPVTLAAATAEAVVSPEPPAPLGVPSIAAEAEAPLIAEAPAEPAAEPEPIAAAPAPEPAAPRSAAPEPPARPVAPEPPREDRIPQPTWQVFAPDATPAVGRPLDGAVPPVAPVQPPVAADPQWPVRPDQAESPAMALLANRAHRSSSDALWAASAQEVLARPPSPPVPGAAGPVTGVQPCSSCGLSLSATARFCRRCGTRQG